MLAKATYYHKKLEDAGIPIEGVDGLGNIQFSPLTSDTQKETALALIASLDISQTALDAFEKILQEREAQANIDSDNETIIVLRAALRVVYLSVIETRNKINEMISAQNLAVAPLANRSWQNLIDSTKSLVGKV